MKKLVLFLVTALTAVSANATQLIVRNTTDVEIRLDSLMNQCDGFIVNEDKPVILKPGQEYIVEKTTAIVHNYKICGAGYCSSTAMGMVNEQNYQLNVVLDDGWLIQGIPTPDDWVGNLECPK